MANKTVPLIRRKGRDIVQRAETAASYTDGSHDLRITVDNGAFIGTQSSTNLVLKTNNTNRLSIHTDGSVKLHNYGSGSNTGTSAYHLAVDSSGNVIESPAVNGTSGTSGSSGNNGNNGANGTSGTSGSSGNNGNNGANGTSGTSGSSGNNGNNGANGTSGVNGNNGANGTSGTSGSSGNNGNNGANGTSGVNGNNGANGTSGTSGSSGNNGNNGANGTSGTSGSSGNNGNNGANGTSGTSGSSGNNGNNGNNGTSGTSGLLSLSGTTDNGIITLNGSAPNATVESNVVINGGSLGIGTTSPSQPLHINGNGLATRFVSNYFGIYDGATFDCYMYVNDANPTYGSYSYGGTFEFVSDVNKAASLLDAGGVRIQRSAIVNDHWEVYHDTTSDDLVFNFIG